MMRTAEEKYEQMWAPDDTAEMIDLRFLVLWSLEPLLVTLQAFRQAKETKKMRSQQFTKQRTTYRGEGKTKVKTWQLERRRTPADKQHQPNCIRVVSISGFPNFLLTSHFYFYDLLSNTYPMCIFVSCLKGYLESMKKYRMKFSKLDNCPKLNNLSFFFSTTLNQNPNFLLGNYNH